MIRVTCQTQGLSWWKVSNLSTLPPDQCERNFSGPFRTKAVLNFLHWRSRFQTFLKFCSNSVVSKKNLFELSWHHCKTCCATENCSKFKKTKTNFFWKIAFTARSCLFLSLRCRMPLEVFYDLPLSPLADTFSLAFCWMHSFVGELIKHTRHQMQMKPLKITPGLLPSLFSMHR